MAQKRIMVALVVCLACVSSIFAQEWEYNVTGRIVDKNGNGIEGIVLRFLNVRYLRDTTDADGYFGLQQVSVGKSDAAAQPAFIRNNLFYHNLRSPATVRISAIDVSGKTEADLVSSRTINPAEGPLSLDMQKLPVGIYNLKVEIGSREFSVRAVKANESSVTFSSRSPLVKSAKSAAIDSIFVEAKGYEYKELSIDSYIQDLGTITLNDFVDVYIMPDFMPTGGVWGEGDAAVQVTDNSCPAGYTGNQCVSIFITSFPDPDTSWAGGSFLKNYDWGATQVVMNGGTKLKWEMKGENGGEAFFFGHEAAKGFWQATDQWAEYEAPMTRVKYSPLGVAADPTSSCWWELRASSNPGMSTVRVYIANIRITN